jgi:hypothetical protein
MVASRSSERPTLDQCFHDAKGENLDERTEVLPGWDEARVRDVIAHYKNQSDQQFAEIEAALGADDVTMMAVQTSLVPEVRALLARAESA